ncbi:MAG: zf-TFIIB domain-containing protein [Ardenticatenaceae bacterium]|nr:zf-TFIIB domain-containing protein [Ardenticatenaceae bacterium]
MVCPKCQGSLQTTSFDGIEVEQCDGCRGVWLDLGELPALRQREKGRWGKAVGYTAVYNTLSAPCPRCGGLGHMTRMHDLQHPDITIDTCPVCYGIWLDGGELNKLAQRGWGLQLKALLYDWLDQLLPESNQGG